MAQKFPWIICTAGHNRWWLTAALGILFAPMPACQPSKEAVVPDEPDPTGNLHLLIQYNQLILARLPVPETIPSNTLWFQITLDGVAEEGLRVQQEEVRISCLPTAEQRPCALQG